MTAISNSTSNDTSQTGDRDGRTPTVIVIGAGMSGIYMGVRLKEAGIPFSILEKAKSVGGTWRENRYPGLYCDVPSRYYSYPFEPAEEWSQMFSPGPEIERYFQFVADKYELDSHIQFGREVTEARFDGVRWQLRTGDCTTLEADFVVTACGVLHHPNMPDMPGLDSFDGPCFHSARWDESVDLKGKKVGVIGSGSTGVQIVGAIADDVDQLTHFQRTPQWIFPMPNRDVSRPTRWLMRNVPAWRRLTYRVYRRTYGHVFSHAPLDDGFYRWFLSTGCRLHLRFGVRDKVMRQRLTPTIKPLCKRLVMSTVFYQAVQRDHVEVVTGDAIDHIEPGGVVTKDGQLHEMDVLILATGFQAQMFIRPINAIGKDGVTLDDLWGENPRAYNTIALPNFPNFFMMFGPNNPVANQPLFDGAEGQSAYVMEWLRLYQDGVFDLAAPSREATDRFNQAISDAFPGDTIWTSGCSSWFFGKDGVPNVWPWPSEDYDAMMQTPKIDDFVLEHRPSPVADDSRPIPVQA